MHMFYDTLYNFLWKGMEECMKCGNFPNSTERAQLHICSDVHPCMYSSMSL